MLGFVDVSYFQCRGELPIVVTSVKVHFKTASLRPARADRGCTGGRAGIGLQPDHALCE